jgi:hypothetical protein
VLVGETPVRASRKSAEWCGKFVDVLWKENERRIRPRERRAAADAWEHAHTTYGKIWRECEVD